MLGSVGMVGDIFLYHMEYLYIVVKCSIYSEKIDVHVQ